jgi:hypothetical protein
MGTRDEKPMYVPLFVYAIAAFIAYVISAEALGSGAFKQSPIPYFVLEANSWLHGHWWLYPYHTVNNNVDLTLFHGHWFVAFPPLPALLILPAVAVFGVHTWDVTVSILFGALNAVLAARVLRGLIDWNIVLRPVTETAIVAFVCFGNALWYLTISGSVHFFAHVVAVSLLFLGLDESISARRSPLRAAMWFGLAGLARTDAWAGAVFYLVLIVLMGRPRDMPRCRNRLINASTFLGGMLVFPAISALYNHVRFGSFGDTGYLSMNLAGYFRTQIQHYGLFNIHYFIHDFYYMFLSPPILNGHGIGVDPQGLSLFLVSPAAIYALAGLTRPFHPLCIASAAAIVLTCLPLLTYYNTGWVQFGPRFCVDFLPFTVPMLAVAVSRHHTYNLLYVLIAGSIVVNALGVSWMFHY